MNPVSIQVWITHSQNYDAMMQVRWRNLSPCVPRNLDRLMAPGRTIALVRMPPTQAAWSLSESSERAAARQRVMTASVEASTNAPIPREPFFAPSSAGPAWRLL